MRSNRPYVQIDPDVLERARQIDLLSYLRAYEPSNLVKVKGTTNVYCTAEHDSLKISEANGTGGRGTLSVLLHRLTDEGQGIRLCVSRGNPHGAGVGRLETAARALKK